jgi:hypothetical protein
MGYYLHELRTTLKAVADSGRELRFAYDNERFRQLSMKLLKEENAIPFLENMGGFEPLKWYEWNGQKYATFHQVARYYGISIHTPKMYMSNYLEEVQALDGARVLQGDEVRSFREAISSLLNPQELDAWFKGNPNKYGVWTPLATIRLGLLLSKAGLIMPKRVKLGVISSLDLQIYCADQWLKEWDAVAGETEAEVEELAEEESVVEEQLDLLKSISETEPIKGPEGNSLVEVAIPQVEPGGLRKIGDIAREIKQKRQLGKANLSGLQPGISAIHIVHEPVTEVHVTEAYLLYRDYGETGIPIQIVTTESISPAARIVAEKFSTDECRIILSQITVH